ncbi:MAG: hypothetical protein ACJA07_001174 [Rhodococcus sp. (in: high G+C Gram-positive bacteria)]|jgi:hypothetical protein
MLIASDFDESGESASCATARCTSPLVNAEPKKILSTNSNCSVTL